MMFLDRINHYPTPRYSELGKPPPSGPGAPLGEAPARCPRPRGGPRCEGAARQPLPGAGLGLLIARVGLEAREKLLFRGFRLSSRGRIRTRLIFLGPRVPSALVHSLYVDIPRLILHGKQNRVTDWHLFLDIFCICRCRTVQLAIVKLLCLTARQINGSVTGKYCQPLIKPSVNSKLYMSNAVLGARGTSSGVPQVRASPAAFFCASLKRLRHQEKSCWLGRAGSAEGGTGREPMGSAHVSSETKEERGCSGLASNRFIVRSSATRTSWNPMGWDEMG
ncbi:PREDICTED: uncharacterized protein LOC108447916 [Corvus brachyrhynchos]|uniref:uncharacterized protein LOC108447916 n=1 Tax=Corvus brachyrhynchos TaxID=85066 RepID=UPI0008163551|nr:PREDICTED: uncharacterized protein LOC108447916 [Corvus brachyrhynchos]